MGISVLHFTPGLSQFHGSHPLAEWEQLLESPFRKSKSNSSAKSLLSIAAGPHWAHLIQFCFDKICKVVLEKKLCWWPSDGPFKDSSVCNCFYFHKKQHPLFLIQYLQNRTDEFSKTYCYKSFGRSQSSRNESHQLLQKLA